MTARGAAFCCDGVGAGCAGVCHVKQNSKKRVRASFSDPFQERMDSSLQGKCWGKMRWSSAAWPCRLVVLQAGGPAGWPEQETTEMKRVWTWGTEKWSLMLQMMEICLLGSEGSFWKVTLVIDDDPQIPQRLCRTITEDDNLMANLTEKLQERSELLSVGDEAKTVGFFSNQRSPWDEQFMCWKIPSSAQKVRQAVSECWSSEMQHKAKRKRGQEESRVELQWRCSDGQGRAGFLPFPVSPEPCQRCLIHRGGFGYLGEVDCRKIQQGGDRGTSQSEKNSRWACSGTFLLHFIS